MIQMTISKKDKSITLSDVAAIGKELQPFSNVGRIRNCTRHITQ